MLRLQIILVLMSLALLSCGSEESSEYGKYSRDELRYYAYAPPLVPHKVQNKDCLDCHGTGLVVQGVKAPVSPHPDLLNCQQCHIHPDNDIAPLVANSFEGLPVVKVAEKTQPAGPTLIPHRIFMRENCLVCHNDPDRKETIQTTHPERVNCVQCHIEQTPVHAAIDLN